MTPETPFAALPVRQRGTLEIVDTALKLYRRYFGVLTGWSALVAVILIVGSVTSFGLLFAYPLGVGSCACCIAAAVRGQRMTFGQVWDFTKPRYGALLLLTFLSFLLMFVAIFASFLLTGLVMVAGAWALSAVSASDTLSAGFGIVGFILAFALASILSVFAFAWLGLAPIIACLEDDKRGAVALGRAWDLMKGSWRRVMGLSTLLTLAILAVTGIVGGALALFGQSLDAFDSGASDSGWVALALTASGFFALFFLFWSPIQTLILAVLYLDLRVRNEALDLEWSSYASAPPPSLAVENSAVQAAPTAPELADTLAQNPLDGADVSPASMAPFIENAPDNSFAPPTQLRPPTPQRIAEPETAPETITLSKSRNPSASDSVPNASDSVPNALDYAPNALDSVPNASDYAPNASERSPEAFDSVPNASDSVPNALDSVRNALERSPEAFDSSSFSAGVAPVAPRADENSAPQSGERAAN